MCDIVCGNLLSTQHQGTNTRQDINNRTCTLCITNEVGEYYQQEFVETEICILYKTWWIL